ncbi:MAG: DUF3417 domain-containing protein, partial [Opitutaceae bacterium]
MNNTAHILHNFIPLEIDGVESLAELALDMRSSWHHATDNLWRELDPALWDLTRNPWIVLQTVSKKKLKATLAQPG